MGLRLGPSGCGISPAPRALGKWGLGESGRPQCSWLVWVVMGAEEQRATGRAFTGGGPSKGVRVEPYNPGAVLTVSLSAPTSLQSEFRQVASVHTPQIQRDNKRILWPPDAESRLIGKDPDAGRD